MAADQRKKHLNAGHSSREQHKVKRKKVILSTIRSNITLEWDDKRKSVVPRREQICYTSQVHSFLSVRTTKLEPFEAARAITELSKFIA